MKIFKLKYFALAVVVALQWSCAVNDDLKDVDKEVAAAGAFTIDPELNYIVNGNVTYDIDAIKKAVDGAWSLHADYAHNKFVISTTLEEFERYKDSNIELKNQFENIGKDEEVNSQKLAGPPADLPRFEKYISLLYTDYRKVYVNKFYSAHFRPQNYSNFKNTSTFKAIMSYSGDTTFKIENFIADKLDLFDPINTNNAYYLRNHSNTYVRHLNLFRDINYKGPNRIITLNKNTLRRFYVNDFVIFANGTFSVPKSMTQQ
jgi:hypothetical protein